MSYMGVGHSVLLQLEGVGHGFSNHHISNAPAHPPPPHVLFDQSLSFKHRKKIHVRQELSYR